MGRYTEGGKTMKKTLSRLLAVALTASLVLSGCGGTGANSGTEEKKENETQQPAADKKEENKEAAASSGEEIKDLFISKLATRELQTFNILYTQMASDFENLCNLTDPLLELDSYGKLAPCVAKEWGTEDGGLTWTFKLRDNVKWVDVNGNEKADCIAQDFLTGLEWVLNFHKNDSSNTSMPIEMIKGASEYYEYTKSLSKEEAYALTAGEGSKFREMVAVEAPDAYTLHYTCTAEKPYFDSLMSYTTGMPMSQAMIDELGGVDGVRAMNNENMWYNSCYTMTSYLQGNEKVLTKNPEYWDKDCFLFDTVTIRMVESNDVAYQLYQSGEVDYVKLGESMVKTISENPNHEFHDYLVPDVPAAYSNQFHWNYDKHLEDGSEDVNWNKAIANENFRKAMYYGLDLTDFLRRENTLDPLSCQNDTFTCDRLSYTSDGRDYTDLVKEKINLPAEPKVEGKPTRFDPEKGQEYKAKAMEELTAQGVTFPVELDWFVKGGNQQALDMASRNLAANAGCPGETLPGDALDTLASLRDGGRKFGVVCVDPPAFIKRKKDAEQGLNAYRRVNDLGLQLVENGGILTSCSCSHHLEAEALRRLIAQCAAKRGLNTQLLYQGFQGPDHPVHPSMPETAYLKVFILRVWKD